jgi:hypothetical protein
MDVCNNRFHWTWAGTWGVQLPTRFFCFSRDPGEPAEGHILTAGGGGFSCQPATRAVVGEECPRPASFHLQRRSLHLASTLLSRKRKSVAAAEKCGKTIQSVPDSEAGWLVTPLGGIVPFVMISWSFLGRLPVKASTPLPTVLIAAKQNRKERKIHARIPAAGQVALSFCCFSPTVFHALKIQILVRGTPPASFPDLCTIPQFQQL